VQHGEEVGYRLDVQHGEEVGYRLDVQDGVPAELQRIFVYFY
jgi:hypothetical protein